MIRAFYSGAAGLKSQQTAVDVTANNISNVNTAGYKAKQEKFGDLLYSSMKTPGASSGSANLSVGNGSAVTETVTDTAEGTPVNTGNSTDYCIRGSGFFAVRDASGNAFYTRDGSFRAVQGNGRLWIGDSSGRLVLDNAGKPIPMDGSGSAQAAPGVYRFANSGALQPQGDNLYSPTALSGAATSANTEVKQGCLESSNVDLAREMSNLLMSQRVYQLNSKVVQTADSIEEMANQLR